MSLPPNPSAGDLERELGDVERLATTSAYGTLVRRAITAVRRRDELLRAAVPELRLLGHLARTTGRTPEIFDLAVRCARAADDSPTTDSTESTR